MNRTATFFALVLTQLIAFAALAQTAEFDRAFGGEIKAIAKDTRRLSGSLGLTRSNGLLGDRYEATLGGSLAGDRLWFFAAGTAFSGAGLGPRFQAVDATATAQPVDWSTVTASFSQRPEAFFGVPQTSFTTVPSSFLSLRSTTMLSESSVLNIGISHTTRDDRRP
ncbi:MAG TPA: hypothetical protein VHK90_01315 [Thermoanaerobaculia bacterium]|nr:hypothetical protein [Thermoanaerobaculia bacterium]